MTDPGSPLEATARELGAQVVLADPEVGGRYSALDRVRPGAGGAGRGQRGRTARPGRGAVATAWAGEDDNPALALGAALGAAALAGRDKLVLVDDGTGISGLGDWAEQLIAESTGKNGKGILPVVVETPTAPGSTGDGRAHRHHGRRAGTGQVPGGGAMPHVTVNGPLGAQFLVWEVATAFAGRLLGINPFDQPNVTESKRTPEDPRRRAARRRTPPFVDGPIEGYAANARRCHHAGRCAVAGWSIRSARAATSP